MDEGVTRSVLWNPDLLRYIADFIIDDYPFIFVMVCREFHKVYLSMDRCSLKSQISIHCESKNLLKWAISVGCPSSIEILETNNRIGIRTLCDFAVGNKSGDISALQWLRSGQSPIAWSK